MPHIKFILPTAAKRNITVSGGASMPDLHERAAVPSREDEEGVQATRHRILAMVDAECAACGIPPERVVLAGFSQGGGVALYVGLTAERTLGGVLGLSCRLPVPHTLPAAIPGEEARRGMPILQIHGEDDGVIPLAWSRATHEAVRSWGFSSAAMKVYPMLAHSIDERVVEDASNFLRTLLPPISGSGGSERAGR
eukprot:tig00021127_g18763.t1